MKNFTIRKLTLALALAGLTVFAANAQTQSDANAMPQLPGPATEVLKLTQAKVEDDTIRAYIANSKASYSLTADQIIYLKQQGVSTASLNAMLNQPKSEPAAPATAAYNTAPAAQPTTTVVQTVPATTYYYSDPYYYPAYYPAYYGWGYPAVSLSWGWRGGWGDGGGWHGGGGGWHGGGGGWHGGGGGGWHGGGHR
jgi:hypothetical protein